MYLVYDQGESPSTPTPLPAPVTPRLLSPPFHLLPPGLSLSVHLFVTLALLNDNTSAPLPHPLLLHYSQDPRSQLILSLSPDRSAPLPYLQLCWHFLLADEYILHRSGSHFHHHQPTPTYLQTGQLKIKKINS